jgi:hypothetical protein
MMMVMGSNTIFNPSFSNASVLPNNKKWDMGDFDKNGGSAASAALKVKMDFRYVLSDIIKYHLKSPLKNGDGTISVFDENLSRGANDPQDGFLIKKA